jgi:hypothetical protein
VSNVLAIWVWSKEQMTQINGVKLMLR